MKKGEKRKAAEGAAGGAAEERGEGGGSAPQPRRSNVTARQVVMTFKDQSLSVLGQNLHCNACSVTWHSGRIFPDRVRRHCHGKDENRHSANMVIWEQNKLMQVSRLISFCP